MNGDYGHGLWAGTGWGEGLLAFERLGGMLQQAAIICGGIIALWLLISFIVQWRDW